MLRVGLTAFLGEENWEVHEVNYDSDGKEYACNARDLDSTPGSGRSSGEGNGNPIRYIYIYENHNL